MLWVTLVESIESRTIWYLQVLFAPLCTVVPFPTGTYPFKSELGLARLAKPILEGENRNTE